MNLESFTVIIASHISSEERLYFLEECLDNCTKYFDDIILAVSYSSDEMFSQLLILLGNFSQANIITSPVKLTQFQHIERASKHVNTKNIIMLDDDDMFLPSVLLEVPKLLERYGQHAGIQYLCNEDGPILDDNGIQIIEVDFSGTFCSTNFLLDWLEDNQEELDIYDVDVTFVEDLSRKGRGIPDWSTDFGRDKDILPYIYRRIHGLERDYGN